MSQKEEKGDDGDFGLTSTPNCSEDDEIEIKSVCVKNVDLPTMKKCDVKMSKYGLFPEDLEMYYGQLKTKDIDSPSSLSLSRSVSTPPPNLRVNMDHLSSSPSSIFNDFVGINPDEVPEEERTLSNNIAECCTHLCRICGKSVTVKGMRNHTRTFHGFPISTYTAQFGNYREKLEKATWHKCGLCAKVFLLDGDEIHKHCNSHRIMMAEYTKMFIVNNYNSTRRGRGSRFQPQNIKLVNMNVNPNANMKTIELGTKTIGTIRIRKESADSKSHADLPSVLNNQALSPGPILPNPPADVFGTINEIENILAKLPDTL